jgi:hypothetical protein
MKQARRMMLSTGYQYWTPSLPHAIAAGDKLFEMYSNLAGRKRSIETISKREALEIDNTMDPQHLQFKVPPALKTRFLVSYRTSRAQAYVSKFTSLIANFGRSVRLVSKNTWINRLRNMMSDPHPSPEYRSVHTLEYLVAELAHRWIYCRQLSVLVQLYYFGVVAHSSFGSYRVELIVKLFDRIVDLHNFQFVLMHLTAAEHAAVMARIGEWLLLVCSVWSELVSEPLHQHRHTAGILNYFNPCNASGGLQLDLSRWDERQVQLRLIRCGGGAQMYLTHVVELLPPQQIVKMLIHLSTVEPGENCKRLHPCAYYVKINSRHPYGLLQSAMKSILTTATTYPCQAGS